MNKFKVYRVLDLEGKEIFRGKIDSVAKELGIANATVHNHGHNESCLNKKWFIEDLGYVNSEDEIYLAKGKKSVHDERLDYYIRHLEKFGNTCAWDKDKPEDYPELMEMFPTLKWRKTVERYEEKGKKPKPYYILEL